MRLLGACVLCAAALAGPVDDLLFRARHAQVVRGDLQKAIELYKEALGHKSLDGARQAEVRLRIALCHEGLEQFRLARDYLEERIYENAAPDVRRLADEARRRIDPRLPKAQPDTRPAQPDPAQLRRARLREHVDQARRFLESGHESRALYHARRALEIDPEHAEARAMRAKLETRLSGVAEFVRDALSFVRRWTDAHVTSVARQAEALLKQALRYADSDFAMAEGRFREAIRLLRASEFAEESERLVELQHRILVHWRLTRAKHRGEENADPQIGATAVRSTLRGDYLNLLQTMLDVVSSPDREYRILPVPAYRPARRTAGWRSKPQRYLLFQDRPSRWTPALFAQSYLPLRVKPESWAERGNFIDAVGGMLMARNRPAVLDLVQREVERLKEPPEVTLPGRFLLVAVDADALRRFEEEFGELRISYRGPSPVSVRTVPAQTSLGYLCSFLRDQGAEVDLTHDAFSLDLANGAPQTFFVAAPIGTAAGYEDFKPARVPPESRHYGLLLDAHPLRGRLGRMALALRLASTLPAPPLRTGDGTVVPRFTMQEAELFVDIPPGATLVVAGLRDPFAEAGGAGESSLLLLWENAGRDAGGAEAGPPQAGPLGAQIPLRDLLLNISDDPGPRGDGQRGFVRREPLEVLASRAVFLEETLRAELGSDEVTVDIEEAVANVPPALRENAAGVIAALERESERTYVVRIQAGAVRTSVFERWMRREDRELRRFGAAYQTFLPPGGGDRSLGNIVSTVADDPFAPGAEWAKLTARGLQARHGLRTRTRTSPAYESENDLDAAETRTITEGLRVMVRPLTRLTPDGAMLRVHVEVETAGLESETEELVLSEAVPSYRTRVTGTRVAGAIDLGDPRQARTALICRIPHPTASRADRLTEIVVAVSVRPVP